MLNESREIATALYAENTSSETTLNGTARPISLRILTTSLHASLCFLLLAVTQNARAEFQSALNPIIEIQGVSAGDQIFKVASSSKPLVLKSQTAAAKYFRGKDLEKLVAKVDFDKQVVLVFAWRGSGQDRLTFNVLESYPEQIPFKLIRGRTKDLRPHVHIFALRKNVVWRTDDPTVGSGRNQPPNPGTEPAIEKFAESVQVVARGKLAAGIFAIGGETTGITLTAKNMTLELELGRNPRLMKKAATLDGKPVVVTGELTMKKGVEIGARWIIVVSQLNSAADDKSQGVSSGASQGSDGPATDALKRGTNKDRPKRRKENRLE